MAPDEETKDELAEKKEDASSTEESVAEPSESKEEAHVHEETDDGGERPAGPMQLGTRRFVYAAYFAGAIAIAFLGSKIGDLVWGRLEAWKPEIGDPKQDLIMPIAAVVGALVAFYYWKKQDTRQYAEEVATELAQVTWPSRSEVTNSTFVVIVATAFSTIFFALMDRFWAFLTDLVYRF